MNQFIHLPISLLTSKSLVDMHLNFGSQLTLPSFIEFPNLNYLSLHYTSLVDYMGTSTVVLSCPSLESLSIEDGGVNPLKNLVIDAPKLEEFYITKLSCEDVLDESAEIKVLAPNLIYFECENCMSRKFSFNDLSCLDHACFGLMTNYYGDQFNAMKNINARRMIEAVSPHIKYLTLNEELAIESLFNFSFSLVIDKAFFGSPYVLENASMQFCNLKHLDLTVYLYRNSIIAIMHLLKLSPGVETLYLDVTNEDPANMPKCDNLCISEESLLQHLRLVEIEGAMGSESELKLMEFVLKNAAVLEKVSICCSNNAKPHMLVNFNKKLNGIPRASSPQISVPFPCHGRALL
ncbi:hypothetical protein Sjap_010712 [Stephania japonica]|uniref:FBD domain-containing protein n=1 Tax=Stephania japonica TaxID=461633 RepID=A0AAP0P6Q0_9MAGN